MANLVKLNTNESPFGPSPLALEAMRAAAADTMRLYPDPEATELRDALAAHHGVTPEQVFVGNGSNEVLAHAFAALLKQPKPLLFPDVTYSFYPVWAQLFGLACETVPLDGAMRIRVEDYRREAGSIVIANPNVPTGLPIRAARLWGLPFCCGPCRSALRRLTNCVHVRDVLRPRRRQLGGNEVARRDEARRQPARRVNHALNAPLPCRVEVNAGDVGQDVNADWLPPHAEERTGFGEVGGGHVMQGRAELGQRRENLSRVRGIGLDEDVEVFGRARLRVNGDGVGPDDKILNAALVQNGQEFFEVSVHAASRLSARNALG